MTDTTSPEPAAARPPAPEAAIDALMLAAGRCALRTAPLPGEVRQALAVALGDCLAGGYGNVETLLVCAADVVVQQPHSYEAMSCLHAARDLVARKRADAAAPGSVQADPRYWWEERD